MAERSDGATLLTTLVNFGALTAFLLLHVSVLNHYLVRRGSKDFWRHAVSPILGFLIIGYVIIKANVAAQKLGLTWLAVGIAVLIFFYATGRRPQLAGMAEAPSEGSGGSSSVEEEGR